MLRVCWETPCLTFEPKTSFFSLVFNRCDTLQFKIMFVGCLIPIGLYNPICWGKKNVRSDPVTFELTYLFNSNSPETWPQPSSLPYKFLLPVTYINLIRNFVNLHLFIKYCTFLLYGYRLRIINLWVTNSSPQILTPDSSDLFWVLNYPKLPIKFYIIQCFCNLLGNFNFLKLDYNSSKSQQT